MAKQKVWYGQLDRFGYTLTTLAATEEAVRKALIAEYKKAYMQYNYGSKPDREELACAKEEIYAEQFTLGDVHWL